MLNSAKRHSCAKQRPHVCRRSIGHHSWCPSSLQPEKEQVIKSWFWQTCWAMVCLAGKISSSVEDGLRWRWCSLIHVDLSARQSEIRTKTVELPDGNNTGWVSSAYKWYEKPFERMIGLNKEVYMAKRMGPSTAPWATPVLRQWDANVCPNQDTLDNCPEK